MFIKLTTIAGLEAHYNVVHILFFLDSDLSGTLLKLVNHDVEAVRESAEEIHALIAQARREP